MWEQGDWNHMWGVSMWFWGLLLIVVLVLFVKYLAGNGNTGASGSKSAREILDERYANGEIDQAEYEERKKNLSN